MTSQKHYYRVKFNAWNDVLLVREGTAVALSCSDATPTDIKQVTWLMMPPEDKQWMVLLSVNITTKMAMAIWRKLVQLGSRTMEISEDVALRFTATVRDGGHYSCQMHQGDGRLEERIVLLALVKLTSIPASSIPTDSIVGLKAEVSPSYAVSGGTWLSSTGVSLLTDVTSAGTLLTKLPRVTSKDSGLYTCSISVDGQSSKPVYNFTLTVTVTGAINQPAEVVTSEPLLRLAALSYSAVSLHCPPVYADYVRLYWWRPDDHRSQPKLIFQFDRWRNFKEQHKPNLQLLGPSSSAPSRNFSFLLKPELMDAGRYQCEVFLDDRVFGQVTTLTVLHGYSTSSSLSVELNCAYAERSQVASVKWLHFQRPDVSLPSHGVIGRISISVNLPVSQITAGQYICALKLKNDQTVRHVHTIKKATTERPCCEADKSTTDTPISLFPAIEGTSTSEASVLLSSLILLLFLVPVAGAVVGVLLWRRGPCTSSRNVERTLSHYSGEVENIYENPEDLRQSPPSAVYMDLKLTGETDVYRELDRYDQCCG
ncbi:g6f-like [Trichomycterus rosablanca]|uniref:g6f-like n=1 Tax=Trichomycterus rosablanca TaxID=2290929 RepID=UPI002F351D6F